MKHEKSIDFKSEYESVRTGLAKSFAMIEEKYENMGKLLAEKAEEKMKIWTHRKGENKECEKVLQKLETQINNNYKVHENFKHEFDNRKKHLKEIEQKVTEKQVMYDEIEKKISETEEEINNKIKALETSKKLKEDKLARIKKVVSLYNDYLRLSLNRSSDDCLMCVFNNIDPKHPDHNYFFKLKVTDDKVYKVTQCVPEVADLPKLMEKLNETNDLSGFMFMIRRMFKNLK